MAFRLAETVNLPVMVVLDAFFLSHTFEVIDVPDQETVNEFLPEFKPSVCLDQDNPFAMGQMAPPPFYMEMRHNIQQAMMSVHDAYEKIEDEFDNIFGNRYGKLDAMLCEDADVVLVMAGTAASTARTVVSALRKKGVKAGLVKIRMFRPFPVAEMREALKNARMVAVVDRNCSFGVGGIFAQEIRAALSGTESRQKVAGFITGLGGRDVTPEMLEEIYEAAQKMEDAPDEAIWVGLNN